MNTVVASTVLLLSSLGWLGQVVAALAPRTAARWGLTESARDVDPTFFADVRAESLWDALSLWTLPLAAVLLLAGNPTWAVFGLVGGGMFVYFGGRGIAQRLTLQRHGIAIGPPSTLKAYYVFLALWAVAGAGAIVLAAQHMTQRS